MEQIMIVQTHIMMKEMEKFSYFFQKKAFFTYSFFFEKIRKFFHFLHHNVCLNNHNLFHFGPLGTSKVCRSISNTQTFYLSRNCFGLFVFHHFYSVFNQKPFFFAFFGLKSRILMGNRQTKKISTQIKCLSI